MMIFRRHWQKTVLCSARGSKHPMLKMPDRCPTEPAVGDA